MDTNNLSSSNYQGLSPYQGSPDFHRTLSQNAAVPGPGDIQDGNLSANMALPDSTSSSGDFLQQIMAIIEQIFSEFLGGSDPLASADPSSADPSSAGPSSAGPSSAGPSSAGPSSADAASSDQTSSGPSPDPSSSSDSATSASQGPETASSHGGTFDAGPNKALAQWTNGINNAAYVSGMDPNLIGGQMWAESRGNPNDPSRNVDGTTDLGLMQISQERWERDIVPNLTADERARIKEVTGKDPSQLDMHDPNENIIGGSLELANWIREKGSVEEGLRYYVSGGDPSIGSPTYVQDVLHFKSILDSSGKLPD